MVRMIGLAQPRARVIIGDVKDEDQADVVYESCSESDTEATEQPAADAKPVKFRPKSGRVWKDKRSKRFSTIRRNPSFNTTWEAKTTRRQEQKVVKELQREVVERKRQERADKATRRKEQEERKKANALKAEVVQVIKNPKKLKRLKKKQLRQIEKRDTLDMSKSAPAAT